MRQKHRTKSFAPYGDALTTWAGLDVKTKLPAKQEVINGCVKSPLLTL